MGFKKSKKKKSSAESAVSKKPTKTILKRKQMRKEKRQSKKTSKLDFYKKKFVSKRVHNDDEEVPSEDEDEVATKAKEVKVAEAAEAKRRKEEKKVKEEQRQAAKQRRKQLKVANEEEKQNISKLEKQLGLKRRKSKNLPKSFTEDGLDYLINVCDSTKIEALGENLSEEEDDEEFVKKMKLGGYDSENSDNDEESESEKDSDEEMDNFIEQSLQSDQDEDESGEESESAGDGADDEDQVDTIGDDNDSDNDEIEPSEDTENIDNSEEEGDKTWEDIYGRTRSKDGAIVPALPAGDEAIDGGGGGKYLPPAARKALEAKQGQTEEKKLQLQRLAKQLKGQLNRLAESNMAGIAKFVEGSYRQHARNDVNQTITDLVISALVAPTLTPNRLVMEHVMLLAILHANVGTEVGAHFLQNIVRQFSTTYANAGENEELKEAHNLLLIISYVFSFKMVGARLVFDMLDMLVDTFSELDIELVLLALRNCGFALRKEDPVALKALILKIQGKAAASKEESSRVQFMLEVLMAIKNNNMAKIPNYDPSHFDQLKKSLRSLIRDGNSLTELNIGYKDLLAAETAGRWWIVGSAFTGSLAGAVDQQEEVTGSKSAGEVEQSHELLELARKMRMNTEVRKKIFCLIMSAEDYLEATERLVKLGTKNHVEREVLFVVVDCCVQEKTYNPYYGHLAAKLASIDRRYRIAGQFTIWDKLKLAGELNKTQLSNLAKITAFLVQEKAQSLGILKVIEFAEMNKHNVRFLKEVLTTILMEGKKEDVATTFKAISSSNNLSLFRESLRLFFHHFLLRPGAKLAKQVDRDVLSERVAVAETALMSASSKLKL